MIIRGKYWFMASNKRSAEFFKLGASFVYIVRQVCLICFDLRFSVS